MTERQESTQESNWREETQADYDRAAWDYLDWLNAMTPAEREKHWRYSDWVDRWQPEEAVRCPMCGDTVLELKWSKEHTEWQCLEATCRNRWEWRKR